jgi:hypothetical protein
VAPFEDINITHTICKKCEKVMQKEIEQMRKAS